MYISIEINETPIFYVPMNIWNEAIKLEVINKGCSFRIVEDIDKEGLRIGNKLYRMYMKVKPKIRTFKRSIPILDLEEDVQFHLDITQI
jgi:hypothetical protein